MYYILHHKRGCANIVFILSLHNSLMYIDCHQQTKLKHKIEAESENHHILKLSINSWPSGSSRLFGGKTVCSEFFCSQIYVEIEVIIAREQWKYIQV